MTPKEQRDYEQMYWALKRITGYDTSSGLRKSCQKMWGLVYEEWIGAAYENIQSEAKAGLKRVAKPKEAK